MDGFPEFLGKRFEMRLRSIDEQDVAFDALAEIRERRPEMEAAVAVARDRAFPFQRHKKSMNRRMITR